MDRNYNQKTKESFEYCRCHQFVVGSGCLQKSCRESVVYSQK